MSETYSVIQQPKPPRKSNDPTKADWIIRAMKAENTVRAQDVELETERKTRLQAELVAHDMTEENQRLRARDGKLTSVASFLAVLAIVLAFMLIGGAR